MKREILFRGKRLDNGQWVEGNVQVPNKETLHVFNKWFMWDEKNIQRQVDPETVGQFTGMTDKKGKKLFEGDVYSMGEKNILYVVIFDKSQFIGKQVGNRSLAGLEYWKSDIEIVGSVHDNPELL